MNMANYRHYCTRCQRSFHPLGIARHRAMHLDKGHNFAIIYANGVIQEYNKKGDINGKNKGKL